MIVGDMLSKTMLSNLSNIPPQKIKYAYGPFGKPYAYDLELEFNISHSNDIVVCCVDNKPIGIDVEKNQAISDRMIEKVCNKEDLLYVCGDDQMKSNYVRESIINRFFDIWTAKEAYFKCKGTGITRLKTLSYRDIVPNLTKVKISDYTISIYKEN